MNYSHKENKKFLLHRKKNMFLKSRIMTNIRSYGAEIQRTVIATSSKFMIALNNCRKSVELPFPAILTALKTLLLFESSKYCGIV